MKILFIGLPASGKSTYSDALAKIEGKESISTDNIFRVVRAMPAKINSEIAIKFAETMHKSKPNEVNLLIGETYNGSEAQINKLFEARQIMADFLSYSKEHYADKYKDIYKSAHTIDEEKGICALSDSKLFRSYGEDVFRRYEIFMNKWLNERGMFEGKMVSTSASAPLYEENKEIFSKENGYNIVMLNPTDKIIVERLVQDYNTSVNESKVIRGAYEIAVQNALSSNPENKETAVREALSNLHQKNKAERMDRYKAFADIIIDITEETNDSEIANSLVEIKRQIEERA